MTAVNRNTLYSYFTTGARPTQQQFANLIDSTLNIVEASGQAILSDVSALGSFAVSGAFEARSGALFKSDVNVSGNLSVTGAFSPNNISVTSALTVTGQSSLSGVTISGTTSAQAINAAGNIKANGTLTVGGATVLASAKGVTPALGTSTTDLATTAFANPPAIVSAAANVPLPSGLIFKVGSQSSVGAGAFTITYPTPFPTNTNFAWFVANTTNGATNGNNVVSAFTASGFSGTNNTGATITATWFAAGY